MQTMALPFLLLFALACMSSAETPVTKVISMLTDMKAKGIKEMENEQVVMGAYEQFVRDRVRELKYEIKTAKASIEKLIAAITKAESEVAELTTKIANIDKDTVALSAQRDSGKALREEQRAKFLEEQTSYTESLYAIDHAIQILKASSSDWAQATALLQKSAKTQPGMRRVLAQLELLQIQARSSSMQPSGAPAVAAYEFESTGIIDMLKGLQDKFRQELGNLEKEESNAAHAHEMLVLHLTNTLEDLKEQRAAMAETKGRVSAELASAKGELVSTRESLADAQKYLADVEATYETKKAAFASNQQTRKEELEAIGKAVEILSSPEVTENYKEHVKLLQIAETKGTLTLLQLRAKSVLKSKTIEFLQGKANELDSKSLDSLVAQLADSPFTKVIAMIKDLLARLKEEAASEAEHKKFCDEELGKNKKKRVKFANEVERLEAESKQTAMLIEEMADKIQVLAEEQAALSKAMKEATEQRQKEKAANLDAIQDADQAKTAVKAAVAVLKEFYAAQGGSFLQTRKQVPEMSAYKGMQGLKGGVLGMLEVIESDFVRVSAETKAAEAEAARAYDKFMTESEADFKRKHDAEFKLSMEKDQKEFDLTQLEKDLTWTNKRLDEANAYFNTLKPQCLEVPVNFEERAAKRKEEIEALKQAYAALDAKK